MAKDSVELGKVIADLKLIKEAVSRSDSILKFIDAPGVLRGIMLASGLLIAFFAAVFCFLLEQYGTMAAFPPNLRIGLFVLMILSFSGVGFWKVRNLLHGTRQIGMDITLNKLFKEIYSPRLQALHLPYIAAIILLTFFLSSRGHHLYIIPSLAVLFGLLVVSLSSLFSLKEFYFLGLWLTATGLLSFFLAPTIHPLTALVITFAAGFILASLLLYLDLTGEKGQER